MTNPQTTNFHRHVFDVFNEKCRVCGQGRDWVAGNEEANLIEQLENIVAAGSKLLEKVK